MPILLMLHSLPNWLAMLFLTAVVLLLIEYIDALVRRIGVAWRAMKAAL